MQEKPFFTTTFDMIFQELKVTGRIFRNENNFTEAGKKFT
jgi:hypothetical protein